MSDLALDLQSALRSLRRRPGFTLLAVLTLAVGMAVNTVAFSVVNGLLYKHQAFREFDRLGWIFVGPKGSAGDATFSEYRALAQASSLDAVIGEGRLALSLRENGRAETVWAMAVSPAYFPVLGARVEAGRTLVPSDGSEPVAMVSHAFWQSHLHSAAPGQASVVLNNQQFFVVGVLPAGFQGPGGIYMPDVWVSFEARDRLGLQSQFDSNQDWLTLVGRLRPSVRPAQAEAELAGLVRAATHDGVPADTRRTRTAGFVRMADGHPEQRALARAAAVAMGAVSVVLFIACFNVAGLLLARATERRREMAMRSALGASAGRLVRQLMVEALLLAVLAGGAAIILSWICAPLLSAFSLPAPIPQAIDLSPDVRTLGFTLLMVCVGTLVPTLFPARQAVKLDLQRALASETGSTTGSHGRVRTRRVFQVLQVAGSTLFLALALLFGTSFHHALAEDTGFDNEHILVITAEPTTHGRTAPQAQAFVEALVGRLRADPRVKAVASTTGIPYSVGVSRGTTIAPEGADCRRVSCAPGELYRVDPDYHRAMGIAVVAGRRLGESDRLPGGGVVVNRVAAARLWPGRSPLGERIAMGASGETAEVVGVVGDVAATGLGRAPGAQVYRAMQAADYSQPVTIVVGTRVDPGQVAERVRTDAASVDATIPLLTVKTMAEHLALPLWAGRVAVWFLSICGGVALVLASIGLFGVISYGAAQRRREFGIRMALGAGPANIYSLVFSEGFLLAGVGVALGLAAGAAGGKALEAGLVGVSATDPMPYLLAALVQAAVALVACAQPAHRATRLARTTLVAQLHE